MSSQAAASVSMPPPFMKIEEMQPTGRIATSLAIAMLILTFLSVILRFVARSKSSHKFGIEDGLAVASLVFFAAYVGTFIRGLQENGGTLNKYEFSLVGAVVEYKYLYAEEIVFTFTITLVKLSILFFYTTIFPTNTFKKLAWTSMGLCMVWLVLFVFLIAFQCSPVHAFWELQLVAEGKATCIPIGKLLVGYEVTNILVDVLILSLPVVMIRSLQLPRTRKLALGSMFLLGGLVIVVCIIRISYLANVTNSNDGNTLFNALNWSTVELAIAILCANAPTWGPLFRSLKAASSTWSRSHITNKSSHRTTGEAPSSGAILCGGQHQKATDGYNLLLDTRQGHHRASASGARTPSTHEGQDIALDEIRVHRSIDVV